MEIKKIEVSKNVTLSFKGWLDTETHVQLNNELEKISDIETLTFDFKELEYISSSGLREVVVAYKRSKDEGFNFKIINVVPQVMSIFTMTGLHKKFDISSIE